MSGGTPPYRYSWNNGDTLSTDTGMAAATYVITVTDASGCLTFEPVNINDATGPTIATSLVTNVSCNTSLVTNVSCNGGSNGAITLNVTVVTEDISTNGRMELPRQVFAAFSQGHIL